MTSMPPNFIANILDLPDDCLFIILDKVLEKKDRLTWSRVCGRFCRIYSESFGRQLKSIKHEENLLDDHVATYSAHLIGTKYAPFKIIKTVRLKAKYTKDFWKNLSKKHPEIEEAELLEVGDSDLKELLPLPNLKRLKCAAKGKHVRPNKTWEGILELFKPDHGLNAIRYAPSLNQLATLQAVEIDCSAFQWWLVLGKLPNLKELTLNKFKFNRCDYSNVYCECGTERIKYLVDGLLDFKKIEKLTFNNSWMTERTMEHIVKLKTLKSLCFVKTIQEDELMLNMFSGLVNLEELQIGNLVLNKATSWRFFRMCDKLTYLRVFIRDEETTKKLKFLISLLKEGGTRTRRTVRVAVVRTFFDSFEIYRIRNRRRVGTHFLNLIIVEDQIPWFGRIIEPEIEPYELTVDQLPWMNRIYRGLRMLWNCFMNMD